MVFIVYFCYGAQAAVNPAAIADFWGARMQARTTVCYLLPGSGGDCRPTIGGVFSTGTRIMRLPFMLRRFWQPSHSFAKSRHGDRIFPARSSSQASACVVLILPAAKKTHRENAQTEVCATKPASHRNAIRRIKLTTESRFSLRVVRNAG